MKNPRGIWFGPCRRSVVLIALLAAAVRPASALDGVEIATLESEEGEYISDTGWTNEDTFNLGIELATSGGAVSFEAAHMAGKYLVHLFFSTAVKPMEFWLSFIQHWRYETGLRAPEEFRMMTLMFLDKRLDVGWLQLQCSDLADREGWDEFFETIYTSADDNVKGTEVEGGFVPEDNAAPAEPDPEIEGIGVPDGKGTSGVGKRTTADDAELPAKLLTKFGGVKSSKEFEKLVNEAAKAGYLAKSIGVPKGSMFIDISYGKGRHGTDGFFIDKKTGKCYLLEMKWHAHGGGKLGQPYHGKITQCSPEWLQKAMLRVKRSPDPEQWLKLRAAAKGSKFDDLCDCIEAVDNHLADYAYRNSLDAKDMENFVDPKHTRKLLEECGFSQTKVKRIGQFWGTDFHVGVLNKAGGRVEHIGKVSSSLAESAKAFGATVKKASKKVLSAKVKGVK